MAERPPSASNRNPRFLHLALDQQFTLFAAKSFEAAFPGSNQFRIADPGRPLHYLQAAANVRPVPMRYWFCGELKRDLAACDCLVVHYMTPWFAKAVLAAPAQVAVMWGAWGGDYYHLLPDFAHRLYLPETARLVATLRRRRFWRLGRLGERLRAALVELAVPRFWVRRALGRVDAATMLPGEHRMLAAAEPAFRARYHLMHYYSAEEVLLQGARETRGQDILLGNSAAPTNNHLEAFAFLRRLDLGERRIVAPLGYGDLDYAEEIALAGARIFGRRFVALRDFMSLADFNRELSACAIVLMNHVRQQAFGTINTAMVQGAKIFLRPENPLLEFYRGMGVRVFELDERATDSAAFLRPLAPEQARANRVALLEFSDFKNAVAAVRGLAKVVADKRGGSGGGVAHV
jgi:hypothetical protein